MSLRTSIIFLSLCACTLPVRADDTWTKAVTPHFELLTSAGEKKAREAILYFEQVRNFFVQASPSKKGPDAPVRIVAFKSEKQFRPYRVNEVSIAFYTHDETRDYIVMRDLAEESYPVAIHEYTHLILRHSGLKIPLWMNEGWADLYSTLKPRGNKSLVGDLIPGHIITLRQSKWIPLDQLDLVDHHSPMYNERDKVGIFYSESWALMHMLYLGDGYRDKFTPFVLAVSSGKTLSEASKEIYGKQAFEMELDLRRYIQGDRFYGAVVNVKLTKSEEDPEISGATPLEWGVATADILELDDKRTEARAAYGELQAQYPKRPEIDASLGYLDLRDGNPSGTLKHFHSALDEATTDPLMCFRLGLLAHSSDPALSERALEKAVELKPDYPDAYIQLGSVLLERKEYEKSVAALKHVPKVTAEQASTYFTILGFDYERLGKDAEARKNAEAARKWAKSPGESEQASALLAYLDQKQEYAKNRQTAAAPPFSEASTESKGEDAPKLRRRDAATKDAAGEDEAGKDGPTASRSSGVRAATGVVLKRPGDQMARVSGVATDLACLGKMSALTIESNGKKMTFVIEDPLGIEVDNGSRPTFDFMCGPQKRYKVSIDYALPKKGEADHDGLVRKLTF